MIAKIDENILLLHPKKAIINFCKLSFYAMGWSPLSVTQFVMMVVVMIWLLVLLLYQATD